MARYERKFYYITELCKELNISLDSLRTLLIQQGLMKHEILNSGKGIYKATSIAHQKKIAMPRPNNPYKTRISGNRKPDMWRLNYIRKIVESSDNARKYHVHYSKDDEI